MTAAPTPPGVARPSPRRRRRRAPALGLCALAAPLIGCGGGPKTPTAGFPSRAVVLGCADAVYGQLETAWRTPTRGTIIAGPIAWPYLARIGRGPTGGSAARAFRPRRGLAPAVKALAVVDAGCPVTVTVPAGERGQLSLDYAYVPPRTRVGAAAFRVAEGATSVTFQPCRRSATIDGRTQFAGGFIVSGAQCAAIDVAVAGVSAVRTRHIAFGVDGRRCPP